MSDLTLTARVVDRIEEVPADAWDACAGSDNPFVSHAFLNTLEISGSVGHGTGWLPQHIVLEDAAGEIHAAVPLYVKGHSQGEYVFDHGWAEAYERVGGRYYPKLQVAVPFSPVPGPRLLVKPCAEAPAMRSALIEALTGTAEKSRLSSLHITFCQKNEALDLVEHGYLHRLGTQYHWTNRGYASFDDFLGELASRKRKAIRKERASVAATGLDIRALSGDDLTSSHWDAFFEFYMDTGSRKWGRPYLNRAFFEALQQTLRDRIVLVMAFRGGTPIAGALNLRGNDALYGRNWGAVEEIPNLHFECCYYRAIDYAIAHKLARVEAGAQGEHKIQRGYLPVETHSAHWIADAGFRDAVADYLARERRVMLNEIAGLQTLSPFRQENDPEK
ncbi:GNAT family N-acetyltransferase [Dongia sp.]|uniref:GNAT family N-acetyltransferase n=1 Tax=Dongia sp. TaxID=1977262 RepID=UPI0035AE7C31